MIFFIIILEKRLKVQLKKGNGDDDLLSLQQGKFTPF